MFSSAVIAQQFDPNQPLSVLDQMGLQRLMQQAAQGELALAQANRKNREFKLLSLRGWVHVGSRYDGASSSFIDVDSIVPKGYGVINVWKFEIFKAPLQINNTDFYRIAIHTEADCYKYTYRPLANAFYDVNGTALTPVTAIKNNQTAYQIFVNTDFQFMADMACQVAKVKYPQYF